ncbi:Superfamily II DNA or RNA helicase, SNF2 family [Marinitoga hydrogenitolerans DSM 16785]|uniref:Superfamily II DNA or RNA helicase, SNF2 family n=1 Tax=Marinitoga hydrogenitolerans (strain DSM 16785 / JCM 12826 / AT1271) TaxID=1122195 RepID=A0A1M4Y6U5_MARH1|nr:DEAD/DEAH box helicase [Marinitoga hydrogenitolerans]SHF01399.1 Superfamily II DNA or RNA helicase, SNF2 family [Marinitoga hydrogenitolerans DSM 16785]
MENNLFAILRKLELLKKRIPTHILEKGSKMYEEAVDENYDNVFIDYFYSYEKNNLITYSMIVLQNSYYYRQAFYKPIVTINTETLRINYECSCQHKNDNQDICEHIFMLILEIENRLKSNGIFKDEYKTALNPDVFFNFYDYGDTYYLIYPDSNGSIIKLAQKNKNRIVLRKDINTFDDVEKFLKTKIPEDEIEIKKLITPIPLHSSGITLKDRKFKLVLNNFEDLKKINNKKILFKNKKTIQWNDDLKFKLYISKTENENNISIKLLPKITPENIMYSVTDSVYYEKNNFSLIKSKTLVNFPSSGDIQTYVLVKNKDSLEKFIKDYLVKYEKYGFEIEIDENLNINKNLFIPKLNIYINFAKTEFHIKGKFLYGKEIELNEDYNKKNIEEEKKLLESLKNAGIELDGKGHAILEIDQFFDFIENKIKSLDKNIIIKMNKNIKKQEIENIHIKLNLRNNWFNVEGEIELKDKKKIDLNAVKNRKNNFIVLKDETFIKIPNKILEKLNDLKFKENKIEMESYNIYSLLNEKDFKIETLDKNTKTFIENIKNFERIKEYDIPELKIPMRDYQIQGYYFLRYLQELKFNGILADDMGLGKTVQTIALILSLKKKNRKFLIITPRSVVYNWANEIEKFSSNLNYYIYHNNQKNIPENTDVILTTYGTIRNSFEEFKKIKLFYIILDEAQYIKNNETKLYKTIRKLKAEHKLALTGTPLENSLNDLYNIFDFLMPGFFGKRKDFLRKYNYSNKESIELLKSKIKPFILRRKKENVLKELPPKTEEYIFNEMTQHQLKIYHQVLQEYRQKIAMSQGNLNFSILEGLLRLRQIVNHPRLLGLNIESSKFNEFKKFVLEVLSENHKIVVFSQFVKMINIMEEWLNEEDIKYSKITGQTKKRVEIIEDFNRNNEIKLLLVSLKAGGTGLNITGADYVIHYDPWWNPAVENQATDRVYRIGQTKAVFVYKFITKNSIEEKILKLKNAKSELYNMAITSENSIIKNLSKEDMLKLFE